MGSKKGLICLGIPVLLGILIFHEVGRTQSAEKNSRVTNITCAEVTPGKQVYETKKMQEKDMYRGELILVNNSIPYQFEKKNSLQCVFDNKTDSYYVKDKDVMLNKEVMPSVNAMMDAYYKEKHLEVNIISGYRSKERQTQIYDKSVKDHGASYTRSYVANPGNSEHHSGLAMDLGLYDKKNGQSGTFTGEGKTSWIVENAYRYGFIQRYQKDKEKETGIKAESWHFRYVGIPHSYIIESKGYCLEEYIEFLKQYKAEEKHLKVEVEGKKYEIYYVKGKKVPVPKGKRYSVSGDNKEGFIVTEEI